MKRHLTAAAFAAIALASAAPSMAQDAVFGDPQYDHPAYSQPQYGPSAGAPRPFYRPYMAGPRDDYRRVPAYGYRSDPSPSYIDESCRIIREPTAYGYRRLRVCE